MLKNIDLKPSILCCFINKILQDSIIINLIFFCESRKTTRQGLMEHLIYLSALLSHGIHSQSPPKSGLGADPFWASDWLWEVTWLLGADLLSGGDREGIGSRSPLYSEHLIDLERSHDFRSGSGADWEGIRRGSPLYFEPVIGLDRSHGIRSRSAPEISNFR